MVVENAVAGNIANAMWCNTYGKLKQYGGG